MFLTLWVHGTAGEAEMPCGEIDIFNVSGEQIGRDILEILLSDDTPSLKMDWFGDLPTEKVLIVKVKDISDDDGLNFKVVGFFEDKTALPS